MKEKRNEVWTMGSRILIVDDNQEIREVVTVLLENEGYEVEKQQ